MKLKIEDIIITHTKLGFGIKNKKTGLFYTNEPDKLWVSQERVNVLWFKSNTRALEFITMLNKS